MINRISIGAGVLLFVGDKLLLQYNRRYERYNIISGHYERELDDYSIKNTCIREVQEELPGLRYLIDFKLKTLHSNRILWEAETIRDGKVYQTLYIFKFFLVNLLFREKDFPERLLASEKEAEEFFTKSGENILVPKKDLYSILNTEDLPESKLSYSDKTITIGLPVKKAWEVYNSRHTEKQEDMILQKELLHSKSFMLSNPEPALRYSSILKNSDIPLNKEEWVQDIQNQGGLVCVNWEPAHPYFKNSPLQVLKDLQETGVDIILYPEREITQENLDLLELFEFIYLCSDRNFFRLGQ